jgi:hypothetical protein
LFVALLAAVAACWSVPEVDRHIINPWLICSDCTQGELDAVVQHGSRATRYLRHALINGPRPSDDSVALAMATEAVSRARRYRAEHGIIAAISSADSLAALTAHLEEFRLSYRLRAAEALRRIVPADSQTVGELCANPPPELVRHPEYRPRFKRFGACQ